MTKDTTKEAAVAAEVLLFEIGSTRSRTGFALACAGSSRRCWRRNSPAHYRARATGGEAERGWRTAADRRRPARPSQAGLTGTFGRAEISVPRARLMGADGKTSEWRSASLRAYQRRTRAADALIAGAYLSGTNTRRVRRALAAVFAGPVGKDVVSRTWRKVKGDWDAWNARSLVDEPIVRLILDGTVVRVRLDRKATSISLAGRARRAGRRPEGAAGDQEHGRRKRGRLACAARRSRQARIADAGAGHRRRRAGSGKGAGGAVARRAGPALHRAQAPQSPRPCARAAA